MLDRHLHPRLKPVLNAIAALLDRPAISPDGLTLFGFAIGVLALPFLALGWYQAALAAVVFNRLLDGLDGALARRRGLTDEGGFLDISLDFLFYAFRLCTRQINLIDHWNNLQIMLNRHIEV